MIDYPLTLIQKLVGVYLASGEGALIVFPEPAVAVLATKRCIRRWSGRSGSTGRKDLEVATRLLLKRRRTIKAAWKLQGHGTVGLIPGDNGVSGFLGLSCVLARKSGKQLLIESGKAQLVVYGPTALAPGTQKLQRRHRRPS